MNGWRLRNCAAPSFRSLMKSQLNATLMTLMITAGGVCLASPQPVRSLEHFGPAVADFDGDLQPDLAIVFAEGRYGYSLQLEFSGAHERGSLLSRSGRPIALSSPLLRLTALDVDGDRDLDIVITQGFSRQPLAVWI